MLLVIWCLCGFGAFEHAIFASQGAASWTLCKSSSSRIMSSNARLIEAMHSAIRIRVKILHNLSHNVAHQGVCVVSSQMHGNTSTYTTPKGVRVFESFVICCIFSFRVRWVGFPRNKFFPGSFCGEWDYLSKFASIRFYQNVCPRKQPQLCFDSWSGKTNNSRIHFYLRERPPDFSINCSHPKTLQA